MTTWIDRLRRAPIEAERETANAADARLTLKDDAGEDVGAGDAVTFSYGIPPVHVRGEVIERDGVLVVLTPGHTPAECDLMLVRGLVGAWYKADRSEERDGE